MTILNSADLRNNLASILEKVASNRQPVLVGRFGQPKAVLIDLFTYNWQKQTIELVKRIDTLTASERETLDVLLDDKARNMLFSGLEEAGKGQLIPLENF